MEYETIAIFKTECSPEYIEELSKKIEKQTSTKPGKFIAKNDWGLKTFAYEIKKQKQGKYMSWTFGGDSKGPEAVNQVLKFEEDILRYVTYRIDNLGKVATQQKEQEEGPKKRVKVDFRNPISLAKFITEKGKIIPRRVSGISVQNQNLVSREIKRAREISLLSYVNGLSTRGSGDEESSRYERRPRRSRDDQDSSKRPSRDEKESSPKGENS